MPPTSPAEAASARLTLDLAQRTPLRRLWRYVGYDEPNYTYTPHGRALLEKLAALADGPYFVRCHFLLCSGDGTPQLKWGSTNVYSEDASGAPVYTWTLIDRIFDTYVELGCVPLVELGFTPEALTTAPPGTPYADPRHGGWRYPPKDYGRWLELVRNLAAHCLARYGLAEVSRWYWELWNEPDIFYWAGSIADYCRLYDYAEAGVHAVLPQARVGGPATTSSATRPESGAFLRAFLTHVTQGTNALTGQRGSRLDFISYHAKGGSFARDPQAAKATPTLATLFANISAGLAVIDDFPELAGREVILSECDPDGWAAGTVQDNPNLFYRNTEYYAGYVASTAVRLLDVAGPAGTCVDAMLTWAFLFEDRGMFEGFRTLSTNGVDKAVLNVFRLLARLGRMRVTLAGEPAGAWPGYLAAVATVDEAEGVQLLLVSHHDDWDVQTPSTVTAQVRGLAADRRYQVTCRWIDREQGNAYAAWVRLGRPPLLTPAQQALLQEAVRLRPQVLEPATSTEAGMELTLTLPSHSVCLVEWTPAHD